MSKEIKIENNATTIDKFLETFTGNGIDGIDATQAIAKIKEVYGKIYKVSLTKLKMQLTQQAKPKLLESIMAK